MILKNLTGFLLSVRTTIWLLCLLIALFFAGSFIMPLKQEFETIQSVPLLEWLMEQSFNVTWWLWGSVGLLVVLTANTIFCSIESIIKKRGVARWITIISPQIIHIGFLLILLAHLFSSIGGFKSFTVVREGALISIQDNSYFQIKDIDVSVDPNGYVTDWYVDIEYLYDGKVIREDRLKPNKPSFQGGLGFYVRDLQSYPFKALLIEVSREPGTLWALVGGIVFTAGSLMLIALKMKREEKIL